MEKELEVLGGNESYFTRKLETYLRAKGISYHIITYSIKDILAAAAKTGFFQIPQVNCPDGSWLVDTTLIIDHLDRLHPEPKTYPMDPAANFISLLLEDYGDEWLWRPAMHYRWSFEESAELRSSWTARHTPGDLSLEEKKAMFYNRQKGCFVDGDGVTDETKAAVESIYLDTLSVLEEIFDKHDFIMGDRPTQADFGFMGSMFAHFFSDPYSGRIMRDVAPGVLAWVTRMWNLKPKQFSSNAQIDAVANDLKPLLDPVVSVYLPYLLANQQAVIDGHDEVSYEALGVTWTEPSKPYRLWCLDRLRQCYQSLDDTARTRAGDALGATADEILSIAPTGKCDHLMPPLPIVSSSERTILDSWGRADSERVPQ
jgi:glutathione S-transferase